MNVDDDVRQRREQMASDDRWIVFAHEADFFSVVSMLGCDPDRVHCNPYVPRGYAYGVRIGVPWYKRRSHVLGRLVGTLDDRDGHFERFLARVRRIVGARYSDRWRRTMAAQWM
ncbi:MAG: hypothetical protein M0R22_12820 [Dehalococcoidia bacterium]|jgi:hypothetical protein|nr:hypothetical protein [Dehalococcoidia bacterium]